jgi:hypothetical protein
MEQQHQRIDGILKQYLTENKERLDNIDTNQKEIDSKLQSLRTKMYDTLKHQCGAYWAWIEKNGTIYQTDKGLHVHINENKSMDADAKLRDLDVCISQHDYGLKEFFDNLSSKNSIIHSSNESCLSSCFYRPVDKSDDDIKLCMNNCFSRTFSDLEDVIGTIKGKIAEVQQKLH